ncbi:MAG: TauD/TfdA family dioxygenase [Hyphomicrobiaceae bacterium]
MFHQNIIKSKFVAEIFRVANTDEDGKLMPPEHPTIKRLSGFGSGIQFNTAKSRVGMMLHGIEVSRTGGITCFTNMCTRCGRGFAREPESQGGAGARVGLGMLARELGAREPTEAERQAMPPVWQPMVRKHPVAGRAALYISPIYNDKIEGMADDEGPGAHRQDWPVLQAKRSSSTSIAGAPHDILMWDNRCTMHYVTPHDPMERRVMHRTTIAGDAPVIAAAIAVVQVCAHSYAAGCAPASVTVFEFFEASGRHEAAAGQSISSMVCTTGMGVPS